MTVVFSVPGKPQAQARPRAFRRGEHVRVFSPSSASKADIANAFLAVVGLGWMPHQGPVVVSLEYRFQAPKSAWAGKEMLTKPDLDNLDKLVLDALNGTAFRDDSQVVAKTSCKRYGPLEHTLITVELLEPTPKPNRRKRAAI